jgi:hypothetical protein
MTILRLSLVALTLAASAHRAGAAEEAALATITVNNGPRFVIECGAEHMPSLSAVGAVLDSNNATWIRAERERLVHTAHRECLRGYARVVFVRDDTSSVPALAMAEAVR